MKKGWPSISLIQIRLSLGEPNSLARCCIFALIRGISMLSSIDEVWFLLSFVDATDGDANYLFGAFFLFFIVDPYLPVLTGESHSTTSIPVTSGSTLAQFGILDLRIELGAPKMPWSESFDFSNLASAFVDEWDSVMVWARSQKLRDLFAPVLNFLKWLSGLSSGLNCETVIYPVC